MLAKIEWAKTFKDKWKDAEEIMMWAKICDKSLGEEEMKHEVYTFGTMLLAALTAPTSPAVYTTVTLPEILDGEGYVTFTFARDNGNVVEQRKAIMGVCQEVKREYVDMFKKRIEARTYSNKEKGAMTA
jgi:hypothetical protein